MKHQDDCEANRYMFGLCTCKPPEDFVEDNVRYRIATNIADHMTAELTKQFHTSATGGTKEVKQARFSLIPQEPLWALAELYGKGAIKYGDWNWSKGYEYSLSMDALCRHLWQWWNGEEFDEETGAHHLTSVAWHAFTMYYFLQHFPQYDDRNIDET